MRPASSRLVLAAAAQVCAWLLFGTIAAQARTPSGEELVGSWRLVSVAQYDAGGKRVTPSDGSFDVGELCISARGRLLAILSRSDRDEKIKGGLQERYFHAVYATYGYRHGEFSWTPIVSAFPDREGVTFRQIADVEGRMLMLRSLPGPSGLYSISIWRRE